MCVYIFIYLFIYLSIYLSIYLNIYTYTADYTMLVFRTLKDSIRNHSGLYINPSLPACRMASYLYNYYIR